MIKAINKEIPIPRYYQLAEHLRSLIHKKKLPPGSALWSQRDLMEEYNLSLSTVRQAYQLLIDEGLASREHGRGFFVADRKKKKVQLKALLDANIFTQEEWRNIIAEFNKKHPYIQINCMFISGYKDHTGLLDSFNPDIFGIDESLWHQYHQMGCLLNLQSYFRKEKELFTEFCDGLLDCFRKANDLYGIPYRFSTLGLFYNKSLFQKNNVSCPQEELTWTEFLELARKLTVLKRNGCVRHYGYGVNSSVGNITSMIWQNKGRTFSPEMECFYESNEVKEAIKFWIEDMLFKYQVSTFPLEGENIDLFIKDKAAMFIGKYDKARRLQVNNKISWGVTAIPKGKTRAVSLAIQALAVSKKTVSAASACEFIKFVASYPMQKKLSVRGWGLPVNEKVAKTLPMSEVFINSLAYAKTAWPFPFRQPRAIISEEQRMLMSKLQSTEVTCNKIARRCRKLNGKECYK